MKKDFSKIFMAGAFIFLIGCSDQVNFALPPATDNFAQSITYNNKVDILWIVDNSSSMLKHQQKLSERVPDFVAKLNEIKMDYHMAVVTSSMGGVSPDGGRFIGTPKFVTSTTPNLVSDLTSRLIRGEAGSDNERGLESMTTSLSPSYLSNEGRGFLRDDALLVVIALTDEDDKSTVSNPGTYYTNFLDGLKKPWVDGSRSWIFNLIGVLSMSGSCKTTGNDYAQVSLVFMDLVKNSGGVQESVCSGDLVSATSNIRARIFQILTDFKLSKVPDLTTVKVLINGQTVPRSNVNGWDYIESLNLIRFYGSFVPAADASIKVDFKPKDAN